jgi:uncharacterized protein
LSAFFFAEFPPFVDIGVHQDGLVHLSAMATDSSKTRTSSSKPGQIVKVKVLGSM